MDGLMVLIIILSATAISFSIVNFIVGMHDTETWLNLQSKVSILETKVQELEKKGK